MKFSVAMSVYLRDRPEWFRAAVQSVIEQSRVPDEVVIVVDGPVTPEIDQLLGQFALNTEKFKIIRLEKNTGHGNARRVGLANCTHELVALMDSDDISLPDRFEWQLKCFEEHPDLSVIGGWINEFDSDTGKSAGVREVPLSDEEIKRYLLMRCPFNQMTAMVKKAEVFRAGGYQDWYCNEDYFLWIRMRLADCKFGNLDKILVRVRVNKQMYNRRGGLRYFKSEARLQKYMLENGLIGGTRFVINVFIRLMVQVIMPNWLRMLFYQVFFRKRQE